MLKRIATTALLAVLAGGLLTSCGGSKSKPTTPTGSLTTLVSDLPGVCDAVSFPFNVTDISLTGASVNGQTIGGTTPINASSPSEPEIRINLGCLRDFTTVLNVNTANAGTYYYAQLWLSEPQMTFYDPTILPPSPPINTAVLTMSPLKFTLIPISPPLVVDSGHASVLHLDFDMLHMIQSITKDPKTGLLDVTATPEFTFTPVTASGSQGEGFGEVDDLVGFVRSVTTVPPGYNGLYNGSFSLQLLSNSISDAPNIPINISSSTSLYGFSQLNQLVTDSFMEVDAYIDVDGNFVATSVEDEYTECLPSSPPLPPCYDQTILAIIGPVTSLTRDSQGNVTSFNLWARDVEPNDAAVVTLDSIPEVNVSTATIYQYSSRNVNFANLPFGPANITVGQELIVHGVVKPPTFTSAPGAPPIPSLVDAAKVYVKLQSIQGSFGSLVQVGDDDKTGAFTLTPCPIMFQGTPAMVLTNNQTVYVNLVGLSSLSGLPSQPTLIVKGLPFYEGQAQTINGVPVPAGTLVILAKQVHQLQ
jgi:hypothetical protein